MSPARKRLKRPTKAATAPAPEPEEPTPNTEFADTLALYRDAEKGIKDLEASIADQVAELKKHRDTFKDKLTEIVEAAGVKKMEGSGGMVTLVRPTRHEVNEDLLKRRLAPASWKLITETVTHVDQKKFEAAILDGVIPEKLFKEAVKEVPANKGHTKVTIKDEPAPSADE